MSYQILEGTLCAKCKYRFSRVMIPFDLSDMEIIDPKELGIEDEDDIILEQHICTLIDGDIEGKVLECNRFEQDTTNNLLGTDVFNI